MFPGSVPDVLVTLPSLTSTLAANTAHLSLLWEVGHLHLKFVGSDSQVCQAGLLIMSQSDPGNV